VDNNLTESRRLYVTGNWKLPAAGFVREEPIVKGTPAIMSRLN